MGVDALSRARDSSYTFDRTTDSRTDDRQEVLPRRKEVNVKDDVRRGAGALRPLFVVFMLLVFGLSGTGDGAAPAPARDVAILLGRAPNFLIGMGNDLSNDHNQDGAYTLGTTLDLHYAYLVGLQGQGGWPDWNAGGTFVNILTDSADAHGVVPMFTLYQTAAWGEGNIGALNNAGFMGPYWSGARLLVQRLAVFNKPAVVHLEPDFWGFAQQQNGNPAAIPVRVKPHAAECADLPDDLTGMGRCLVRLARQISPKVVIGFHASAWSGSTSSIVTYLNAVGASQADIVVVETLDRDAGCFEAAIDPNCQRGGGPFYWDESNATSPSFREHLTWARAIYDGIGRPLLWWQMPFGVPSSVPGGTPGHYRDNRVHYLFAHPGEFVAAGGLGAVFGVGAANQTYITTDGNQFRNAVAAYFAHPVSLPGSLPSLTIDDVQVGEGNGGTTEAVFTVHLSAASAQAVTVGYATAGGTATSGADFMASSGTLSIAAGAISATITVPVVGDLLDEPNETFTVTLSNASGATIADGQATGTIVDDDPAPALAIDDVSVGEGETGVTVATFTVSLSAPSGQVVSVRAATADGTATAGSDYTAGAWTVAFPAGVTTQTVKVSVLGDRVNEADETFVVNLTAPVGATLARAQGVGTILDDDPPGLSVADVDVVEPATGTRNAVFTVTLSPTSGSTVTVAYGTTSLTATAGVDFTASSGTLTFNAGVSSVGLNVPILADALAEGVETFRVDLSSPTGAAIAHGQAIGRIHERGNFFTLAPCRVFDTRIAVGLYGGPALAAGQNRVFTLAGRCSIPASAGAVAVNLTVTQSTADGNLRVFPSDVALPSTSTINYGAGQTRANNAIVGLSAAGALTVRCAQASGSVHAILDVTGYFE
jgi:hypothetical protein